MSISVRKKGKLLIKISPVILNPEIGLNQSKIGVSLEKKHIQFQPRNHSASISGFRMAEDIFVSTYLS